jgi:hypothetical protein
MSNSILQAVPTHWFSWNFTVTQGSEVLANIDVSWWRERGVLTIDGKRYRVYREGLASGDFVLESPEIIVARATKPSAFRRAFIVEHSGRQYTLRANWPSRRAFRLLDGETEIGSISPEGFLTRRAAVVMPQDMPLLVQVFVVWLAIILWKRDANTAAA